MRVFFVVSLQNQDYASAVDLEEAVDNETIHEENQTHNPDNPVRIHYRG